MSIINGSASLATLERERERESKSPNPWVDRLPTRPPIDHKLHQIARQVPFKFKTKFAKKCWYIITQNNWRVKFSNLRVFEGIGVNHSSLRCNHPRAKRNLRKDAKIHLSAKILRFASISLSALQETLLKHWLAIRWQCVLIILSKEYFQ